MSRMKAACVHRLSHFGAGADEVRTHVDRMADAGFAVSPHTLAVRRRHHGLARSGPLHVCCLLPQRRRDRKPRANSSSKIKF